MREKVHRVLVDLETVTWIKFWEYLDYKDCPKVNLQQIRAIVEPKRGSAVYEITQYILIKILELHNIIYFEKNLIW